MKLSNTLREKTGAKMNLMAFRMHVRYEKSSTIKKLQLSSDTEDLHQKFWTPLSRPVCMSVDGPEAQGTCQKHIQMPMLRL